MKHAWKKEEKKLYLPKEIPEVVTIPKQTFFMLNGKGDPNDDAFTEKINVLYSLSYAVRMMPKQGYTPEGYVDYTVYPLEGLWDLTKEGKKSGTMSKDEFLYTVMIRQPGFVTRDVADRAFETVRKKKPHPLLDEVVFDTIEDGLSVQMLHVGPYDDEPRSFRIMKDFIADNRLEIGSSRHREIYLSDARKVEPAELKTVLRYTVKPIA